MKTKRPRSPLSALVRVPVRAPLSALVRVPVRVPEFGERSWRHDSSVCPQMTTASHKYRRHLAVFLCVLMRPKRGLSALTVAGARAIVRHRKIIENRGAHTLTRRRLDTLR